MSHDADSAGAEGSVTACRDGAVLRITLDRPLRRNSLTPLMIEMLVGALTDATADDSLRAIHIRGAGDHFCAGADWVASNSGAGQRPRSGDLVRRIPHAAHRVIELVASIQLLASFPMAGKAGRVLDTRKLVVANTPFIVAYAIERDRIVILAIYHGAQRWPEVL